jgi:ABC-2 type transport system permease protein
MIFTIAGKELRGLFSSPLAWIVLAALQFVLSWIFLLRLDSFLELQGGLQQLVNAPGVTEVVVVPLYSAAAFVLLMITPVLAMRSIAEERRNRTMTLLISAPVSMTQIVLGKFCGLTLFLFMPIVLVSVMAMALHIGADLDQGLIAANALGLVFLVATFGAVAYSLQPDARSARCNRAAPVTVLVCQLGQPDRIAWCSCCRSPAG